MKFSLRCILSFGPLAPVLCMSTGVTPSGPAVVEEIVLDSDKEHICNINYGSKVFCPRIQESVSRLGAVVFSENGELLNKSEIAQKLGYLEGVMPMTKDNAKLTVDNLVDRLSENVSGHKGVVMPILRKMFVGMDLSSELNETLSLVKSSQSSMSIGLMRVQEVISMLNEFGFINATDFCGVYKEIAISFLIDVCDSLESLKKIEGQSQAHALISENPKIKKLGSTSCDLVGTLLRDDGDYSAKAVIEKLIDMEKQIREIVQDEDLMIISSTCAFPECSGNYSALSEEEKERIFLIHKKGGAIHFLSMFALECLKKHIDSDYVTPTEDMEFISSGACVCMLLLADLHQNSAINH